MSELRSAHHVVRHVPMWPVDILPGRTRMVKCYERKTPRPFRIPQTDRVKGTLKRKRAGLGSVAFIAPILLFTTM